MRRQRFASKTFRKTFFSYTAILLIPIIVFSVLNVHKTILEERNSANDKHLADAKRIAEVIDSKLAQLKNASNAISEQMWIQKMMQNTQVYDREFDLIKMLEIRKEFANTVNGLGVLPFGAVIFPDKEQVVSTWGSFEQKQFFASVASFDESVLQKFNEQMKLYHYFNVLEPAWIKLGTERRQVIPVVQSLEVVNNPRASLLLFIDMAYFSEYLQRFGGAEPSRIRITAGNKPVYSQEFNQTESPDGNVYIQQLNSRISDWHYTVTYVSPVAVGIQNIVGSLLGIILSIVIGVITSYLLSIISYRPLGMLLQRFAAVSRKEDQGSEYKLIESSFDRLIDENQHLQQAVSDYESAAKSNLLLRLLKGYFADDQNMNGLRKFGLSYTDDMFYSSLLVSFQTAGDSPDRLPDRTAEIAVIMAAEAVLSRYPLHYELFEVAAADMALILSSSEAMDIAVMERIAGELAERVRAACALTPEVLYGPAEKGLVGISKSYYAANESLQARLFSGRSMRSHPGGTSLPDAQSYYPTDWEIQLINNLKVGNLETVMRILDEISTENRKRMLQEPFMAQLVSRLMDTMLRVMDELNIDAGIYAKQFAVKAKQTDIEAMWSYVFEVGTLLCERIRYSNSAAELEIGAKLVAYVNDHYTSSELSLKKMADVLQMSTPRISRMFKEATGINFYDYVCRLRMEMAKELLRDHTGIDVVAQRVGYDNVYSFRRAFARYEGIKPDEYANVTA
ncbi:AraC family transcriptional regulator [Paenibacillus pasadenensis]|uniref:helix-turn-helix domain-containing protein n=1 Tax=Paenibacillus pasadenensis TaxID=217090 RepID=UPI00203F7D14|nr:AraC family transcriptional regulator [Paenibacillus pasadenensis]